MTHEISAYMEITYSKERLLEMSQNYEKNCELLIRLLKNGLTEKGIQDVILSIPSNNKRTADIVLEFSVQNEEELDQVEQLVKSIGGKSIENVSTYILEDA